MNAFGFYFLGDELSVDFCNTLLGATLPGESLELLENSSQLRNWYVTAKLLPTETKSKFAFKAALELRGALREIYWGIQQHTAPAEPALEVLNRFLEQRHERTQVRAEDAHFVLECVLEGPPDPAFKVAESAAYFLASFDRTRLKKCSNPSCDLLFYDRSKNNSRRWCEMQTCGNRAKQSRFKARLLEPTD